MPEGQRYFGWEVADAAALDALATRLEAAGVGVPRETTSIADQRCVSGLISFVDPAGNRLDAFHGAQSADEPFRPGRSISGFRTGPLGIGHALLMVPSIDAALQFYRDLLGFRISDYIRTPVCAYFLHVNPRHHSLALFEGGRSVMHHLMVELFSFDDVGQGYDIALGERGRIAATLGRHPNDLVTSFYVRTPSEILVEYAWGGREVDDATWQPSEMTDVASFWGHHGLFSSLAGDDPPPDIPPAAASVEMQRAPLHVMDGNYATEKCSSDKSRFTFGSASSTARKRAATSPASCRSRFLQNTVASHTASSIPSPTNQPYSRLYSSSAITRLVGAILLEQNDEWAVSRRYMTLESIAPLSDGVPITLPTVAA